MDEEQIHLTEVSFQGFDSCTSSNEDRDQIIYLLGSMYAWFFIVVIVQVNVLNPQGEAFQIIVIFYFDTTSIIIIASATVPS